MKLIFGGRISRFFLIILIAFIPGIYLPSPSLAGSDQRGVESLDGLVKHLYRDTKHVFTSPFRWKQNDLIHFTQLSIGTCELMLLDRDFQKSVQRNRTTTTDRVSEWTGRYTKRITNLTISGLYLSGLVLHDRKSKETALLCLESVALAEGITTGLKHLIGRSRPYANKGVFDFNPMRFPPPSYSLSFPSGHATTAFALSSVIAEQYQNWVVRLLSYGFASAVALSRININVHFMSDVFWGGIIGTTVGRCLVRFHKKEDDTPGCELIATSGSRNLRLGISIQLR